MKITSLEIKQHEFERSFRGYDIEEVNNFLSNLASEWERMSNETKMLKMQLEIAEKEASKLRVVEMRLIKTLRTAEDTSIRITDNAKNEAEKKLNLAEKTAGEILAEAENQAKTMISEAESKASNINNTAKEEFVELEEKFISLEANKHKLLNQLQTITAEIEEIVDKHRNTKFTDKEFESPEVEKITKPLIEVQVKTIDELDTSEEIIEESILVEIEENEVSFSSAVNKITLEEENETKIEKENLEIIEGIGPKIKEVLNNARIYTFRDLATTPIYRIKSILESAGSHFAIHDPSTWVDQAILADAGNLVKLDELKKYLVAGRVPEKDLEKPLEATRMESSDNSTEEMLDKVNKVKAAIRKAMVEKGNKVEPDLKSEPVEEKQSGGSFFDNIN